MPGLLMVQSNADLDKQHQESREFEKRVDAHFSESFTSSLSAHIRKAWEANKRDKNTVERRLLDCLRRVQGEYEDSKLRGIREQGASEIYMMLTATKQRAASALLRDVLLPTNEKPWGLTSTTKPDLSPEIQQRIMQGVAQSAQRLNEEGANISEEDIQKEIRRIRNDAEGKVAKEAKRRAEQMEDTIEDALEEGGWTEALEAFIEDFTTFPNGFIKGPVLTRVPTLAWQNSQPVQSYDIRSQYLRVSPFDIYPSGDSTTTQDGSNLIELVRLSRQALYNCLGVPGYNDEAIREALRDYGRGGLTDWLWQDGERKRLEGKEVFNNSELIEGIHYWGSAQGLMLLEWGCDENKIHDPLADYEIEGILIGRHVIRCVINDDPLGRRPYNGASFQSVPGSFWGKAPAELMADIQDVCNATARSLVNNMAISSGPQVEVNHDRLSPGEDASQIFPWKIWKTKSSVISGNDPAVRFYQVSSNAGELLNVFNTFESKADDATGIPRYMYGNEKVGGAGDTASGLSMLFESANKGVKAAIGRIDKGVIRPIIEMQYYYEMLYNPDPTIKGDVKVIARGASSMLTRERTNLMRQQFLQLVSNPLDSQIIGVERRVKLLEALSEGLDLPGFMPTEEEVQDILSAQQENKPDYEGMKLELEQMKIQLKEKEDNQDYDIALRKIEADKTKDQPSLPEHTFTPPPMPTEV